MKYFSPTQQISSYNIDSTEISRNRNYPLWHLEDVLLPLFEKNYSYDSLRETIHSANHIWCAYEYGKCIGCALITDIGTNRGLYMLLFGIRKSEQGRGIGKRLLENIIIWSSSQGYRFIYLHTEHDNKKAIGIYEKVGFRREFYLPDCTDQLPQLGSDAIPMVLYLI
jgi:ribosomal protein S18 acetylase RimI-like enzyme